jgi:hypothetical protein
VIDRPTQQIKRQASRFKRLGHRSQKKYRPKTPDDDSGYLEPEAMKSMGHDDAPAGYVGWVHGAAGQINYLRGSPVCEECIANRAAHFNVACFG